MNEKNGNQRDDETKHVTNTVDTAEGDVVGRDKNVTGGDGSVVVGGNIVNSNIFVIDGKALYSPKAIAESSKIIKQFGLDNVLREKAPLQVGDSNYFVQRIIFSQGLGNLLVQTASASDQVMQENVGIFHIAYATGKDDTTGEIKRAQRRAYNFKHAAYRSRYLATVRKIFPYAQGLWVISQWVTGLPWGKFFSMDGTFPDSGGILQMLSSAIDICNALANLHKQREVHGGLSEETIIIKNNHEAVLIDSGFAGQPVIGRMLPPRFDARTDIHALGEILYRSLTHRLPSAEPVSTFNPTISFELESVVQKMMSGSITSVTDLKSQLLRLKREYRA